MIMISTILTTLFIIILIDIFLTSPVSNVIEGGSFEEEGAGNGG